ncbi:MAG: DNA polymerase I [Candidatus Omnitrophica bacterium]|nr:DNA polymerase I [Candidatus Omnitrophota bacterium]
MSGKKLYLLDAMAFCYRAFYAVRGLTTSFGQPSGAAYGFVNILNKVLKEGNPDYLAACFDVSRDTFRSRKFSDYKLQRPPMPDGLSSQIPLIKEILSGYGLRVVEKKGYEADDIIATLANKSASLGIAVTIVSSDKDMLQLVGKGIEVFNPYKDDGLVYNEGVVEEKFGVKPNQIADILSLTGDSADNIPGIPGIGEKTALKLIKEFKSLEGLIGNIDKISSQGIRDAVKANKERAKLNKELVVLSSRPEIEFNLEELKVGTPDLTVLAKIFKRLEFKKLLAGLDPKKEASAPAKIKECQDSDLAKVLGRVDQLLISVEDCGKVFFYLQDEVVCIKEVGENFKKVLSDGRVRKIGHDLKKSKVILGRRGILMEGLCFDTMIAAYLLNPSRPSYGLGDISLAYLDDISSVKNLCAADTLDLVQRLNPLLEKELLAKGLLNLFNDTEMPLANVLAEMELCGVKLDLRLLASLSRDLEDRLKGLIHDIYELSTSEFNINSPKQLRVVLFDTLKLPVVKRTKTGPSTDEEVLHKLAQKHKLPGLLLEYRQLSKLKTTYIDALPSLVDSKTGRLHTSFNQCATETGRLSSSNPNLQNIPIRTEIGSKIRKGIIASSKKNLLMSCDYSQIELRVLAHLSKDKNLIADFKSNRDIHKATAGLVYGVEEKDVTEAMRDSAKRVNFGIVYGLTSFGLSRDLNISFDEAQAFIDAYFLRYPGVKEYIEEMIRGAQEKGFVSTILGRKRYIPEINSKNMAVRQFAQRQAVNTPIQGSASDLIKLAMINVQKEIKKRSLSSKMVLQIHDELLFDLPLGELSSLAGLVKDKMERVLKLEVPVIVDIKQGHNWLEMSAYPPGREET